MNWGMEKPEVKLEDLIRLAEISASSGVEYVRPEEVRKNLIKSGFELWEPEQAEVATAIEEAAPKGKPKHTYVVREY